MSDLTVALLGTGTMGAGMARNIAGAGITLRVWNRTPERAAPLADSGATVCATLDEAVEGADIVITMLWDADSVEAALREAGSALGAGTILLQTTTVGIDGADRISDVAAELGLVHLDAPVLGTRQPAENGALVVLASGPEEVRDRVQPVLDAIGSRTTWVGEAGAGSRLKLVANAFVLSLTGAIAQSLALARALGLEPETFLEAVSGGAMDSGYVQLKGRAMIAGSFEPAFGIEGAVKDAGLILDAAGASQTQAALVEVVREQMRGVVEAGHTGEDMAAVYRAYDATA